MAAILPCAKESPCGAAAGGCPAGAVPPTGQTLG